MAAAISAVEKEVSNSQEKVHGSTCPIKIRWEVKDTWMRCGTTAECGRLTDEDAVAGFHAMQQDCARARPLGNMALWMHRLDLGDNAIGDEGIRALVSALTASKVSVRELRLHRNRIGNAGAQALSRLIEAPELPPMELHLSHNYLPPRAVRILLMAAAKSPHYPRQGQDLNTPPMPMWLRVEQQRVGWPGFVRGADRMNYWQAEEMVQLANQWMTSARQEAKAGIGKEAMRWPNTMLCFAWRGRCKDKLCEHTSWCNRTWSWMGCPVVHVPFLWSQGGKENDSQPYEAMLHKRDPEWEAWEPQRLQEEKCSTPSTAFASQPDTAVDRNEKDRMNPGFMEQLNDPEPPLIIPWKYDDDSGDDKKPDSSCLEGCVGDTTGMVAPPLADTCATGWTEGWDGPDDAAFVFVAGTGTTTDTNIASHSEALAFGSGAPASVTVGSTGGADHDADFKCKGLRGVDSICLEEIDCSGQVVFARGSQIDMGPQPVQKWVFDDQPETDAGIHESISASLNKMKHNKVNSVSSGGSMGSSTGIGSAAKEHPDMIPSPPPPPPPPLLPAHHGVHQSEEHRDMTPSPPPPPPPPLLPAHHGGHQSEVGGPAIPAQKKNKIPAKFHTPS